MSGMAHLHQRVIAGINSIADPVVVFNLEPVQDPIGRSSDLEVANYTRGVTPTAFFVLDFDGEWCLRGASIR